MQIAYSLLKLSMSLLALIAYSSQLTHLLCLALQLGEISVGKLQGERKSHLGMLKHMVE